MARFRLNHTILTNLLFTKRPLTAFISYWFIWLTLHFIIFFPTFINASTLFTANFFFHHIVLVTINFLLFYIVSYFIMPSLGIYLKKWAWVVISSILLTILFTYVKFRFEINWAMELQNDLKLNRFTDPKQVEALGFFSHSFKNYFQIHILNNISIIILAFAYRLSINWYQQEKIRKDLETQKLRAELSYLKMQVNPHFLFNALNNIYSLALIEKSKQTGESIMKLSELMRHVLYEAEDEDHKISLDSEIAYINSYIDLEKLRLKGEININFSIEGSTSSKRIAPLLLFPLIENAFKHGILTDSEKPVIIEMKITDQYMNFSISNYKNNYMKDQVGGIGIQNVRKRLDLLYNNHYALDVSETGDQFFVNLHVPL